MSEPVTFDEVGHKCIPGKSWEYTAGILRHALDQAANSYHEEREQVNALALEVMGLREQLTRANNTIDRLTQEK